MRKSTKVLLIVAAACIVGGGLLGFLGGLFRGGFSEGVPLPEFGGEQTHREYTYPAAGISGVSVDSDVIDVVMLQEGSDFRVTYDGPEDRQMVCETKGGVLTVRMEDLWEGHIRIWSLDAGNDVITVTVPQGFAGEAAVTTSTGDVTAQALALSSLTVSSGTGEYEVTDCVLSGAGEFTATTGDGELRNLTADTITASASTGGLDMVNCSAERVLLSRSTGSVEAEGLSCKALEVTSSTGNLSFENVATETLRVDTSTGNVELEDISVSVSAELKTSTGNIDGSLAGSMADYTIDCSSGTGSCSLPKSVKLGDILLTVTSSTGDIELEFEADD